MATVVHGTERTVVAGGAVLLVDDDAVATAFVTYCFMTCISGDFAAIDGARLRFAAAASSTTGTARAVRMLPGTATVALGRRARGAVAVVAARGTTAAYHHHQRRRR